MTRYLLTGGSGFVGQWLAKALIARGDSVDLSGLGPSIDGPSILSADERRQVRWLTADVRSSDDVDQLVERSQPDVVFHLAGVSFPPDAERSPATAYDVNALGAVRLLGAIRRRRAAGVGDPVTVIVGSGVQYGRHAASEMPLTESAEQRPLSIYGASKAAQEVASLQFWRDAGLRVICTRSFNHSGLGHGGQYLLPSLVARVKRLREQGEHRLTLGNDVVRDYLHIADVVSGYLLLAERGMPGETYNVASGCGISVAALANEILLRAGVTADISTDPSLVRATDIPVLVGSPAKLIEHTGWAPTKSHADIIDDLLNAATE
ncbi:MAG TPA: GDP-mannose 4,6-dehydratase [Gemmatimonadaceae bacterium]|jgi:GDP-4-dehydro-6-deoxy-D-mannose reductase